MIETLKRSKRFSSSLRTCEKSSSGKWIRFGLLLRGFCIPRTFDFSYMKSLLIRYHTQFLVQVCSPHIFFHTLIDDATWYKTKSQLEKFCNRAARSETQYNHDGHLTKLTSVVLFKYKIDNNLPWKHKEGTTTRIICNGICL